MTAPSIFAASLHAAITSTRAMFTNSAEAQAALARVEFMMDSIPAHASIAEESLTGTGAVSTAGPAEQAIQHQARADVAEADQAARQSLTPQQIDKIENRMNFSVNALLALAPGSAYHIRCSDE